MKAVQLNGFEGLGSLRVVEVEKPRPGANEVLLEVKATGVNFAEIEMTKGNYQVSRKLPFVMGFEAAGIVVEVGSRVGNVKLGDKVTAITSSGGYAKYATADAGFAIPIPNGLSFADATTIPVQGLSAYTLLKFAAKPQPNESVLIQAAAGGVGLYLVQLAKILGVKKVIALASSKQKTDLVAALGADVAINYRQENWAAQVKEATAGEGVDVVLEAASGEVGAESIKVTAPFGRIVLFGARNIHDMLTPEQMQQLIYKNQSLIGFCMPTLRPEQIAENVPGLLSLISEGKLKLFANNSFPLSEVKAAFEALASRRTIGKIVLIPE